ncbi:MAG: ABC transporter substrate-binding protein [Hyphomonadaceae bacterium]|nr:ABC transporter substrate-binding protein [Hyphomonadaceae bacterium]
MKDFLKVYWPLALVAVLGLIVALRFVEPPPPKQIVFAGGSPGGAYAAYAERYKTLLADHGVEVEVLSTAGSIENLHLLTVGDADVALIQGGLASEGDAERLLALGGLFYEPYWVFVRTEAGAQDYADLRTLRMTIGAEGSGTRALSLHLQGEYGGTWPDTTRLPLSGQAAADALLAGEVDVATFSAGIDAPYVEQLVRAEGIDLMDFPRAPALSRHTPALAPITLLRGVVDIGGDLPARDVEMIASVAQLGVDSELHPAIHAILLDAANAIHTPGTELSPPDTFPSGARTDLPLSAEARRYYRDGPSALRRYFSFGMANFLERAWVLAIPLLTLLFPLVRAAPPIYRWRVRRKIYVWYEDLRQLEAEGRAADSGEARERIRTQLRNLQEEIGQLEVPLSYTDDLYRLRSHVTFVNQLLGNLDPAQEVEPVSM